MTVKIKIYSDYVCPFCLLAKKPMDEAIEGKDVEVEWMPYELRPYPNETLKPEEHYLQSTWKQSVFPIAEQMGIDIILPSVSPQPHTHLAFEGYQYAKEQGKGNEYNDRMLRAFFQEDQDIGDREILTRLAGEIGLDEREYREALETRKYKEAHQKTLQHAYKAAGITAVPTFVIGDTKVAGIRSKETLEQIIDDEINRQKPDFPEGIVCDSEGC
ncbi:DsbA family oxidoreductase [Sporosarcina sp. Marseille-Q4063]|uniref:DsbA family oxidoreductase n=1 Tax=Sporosarcina sp. Marseille-Q4063 TaxID=2810514 RepID=UPI001BB00F23|nr:DsbA family oxidoreductase [Sporosarcina sp. Marseille-Q4063]QUW20745.1 DsbA family oxidoreductase [Sporosarcina sp. Marseille-Q4063]